MELCSLAARNSPEISRVTTETARNINYKFVEVWYDTCIHIFGDAYWYDDVIKWEHFPRYWPFVRGIHRSGEFPSQRPVMRNFDVFFDRCLNKRSSKQSRRRWLATSSLSLWRHCNGRWGNRMIATVSVNGTAGIRVKSDDKYSLLMHCIKIKSPVKFLLNEQYVFVGGNISFLCVLSCSSEEA